jgi:hypothetical protein
MYYQEREPDEEMKYFILLLAYATDQHVCCSGSLAKVTVLLTECSQL